MLKARLRIAVVAEELTATEELDVVDEDDTADELTATEELDALEEEDTEDELTATDELDTADEDDATDELNATELDDTLLDEVTVKQFDTRTSHSVAPVPRVPLTAASTFAAGITVTLV
jgi:hypothetical protein